MRVMAASMRLGGLLVLTVVGFLAMSPVAHAAPKATLEPGDVVVADQDAGAVLRVPTEGEPEVLLSGLHSVRGVAVLADGAVLAADSDAGAVVGTGGRYGDRIVAVARGLASPEALAVVGSDSVYVTSASEGTLSRINLDTGRVVALSAELEGPSAVLALRSPRSPSHLLVAESSAGSVAVVAHNGDRSATLVDDLEHPAGLTMGPDGTVFVADRSAGQLVAISRSGRERVLAELDKPSGLALDPAAPAAGQDYHVVVTTADGVQGVDPATGDVTDLADVGRAVGVATAPDEFVASGTAAAPPVVEGDGATSGGEVASSSGDDIDPVLVGLVALTVVLAGLAVIAGTQMVRHRNDETSGADARGARRAERSMRNAERKAARELLKAEKRAGTAAIAEPPAPPPGAAAGAVVSADRLFADDVATATDDAAAPASRRERKAAAKRERVEAKERKADAKAVARADVKQAKADAAALAKADAQQAKADAKAAKADDKQSRVNARRKALLDKRQDRVDAAALAEATRAEANQAKADAKAAAAAAKAETKTAKKAAKGPAAAEPTDAVALAPEVPPLPPLPPLPVFPAAAGPPADEPSEVAVPVSPSSAPEASEASEASEVSESSESSESSEAPTVDVSLAETTPPALERVPLFSTPSPPPMTAGPFLVSLFDDGASKEPAVDPPSRSATPLPAASPADVDEPATAPVAVVAGVGGQRPGPEPLADQVARTVPPPSGLFGRRRARRRRRAADRRYQHLRALDEINAVPDLAPPFAAAAPAPAATNGRSADPFAPRWSRSTPEAMPSSNGGATHPSPHEPAT